MVGPLFASTSSYFCVRALVDWASANCFCRLVTSTLRLLPLAPRASSCCLYAAAWALAVLASFWAVSSSADRLIARQLHRVVFFLGNAAGKGRNDYGYTKPPVHPCHICASMQIGLLGQILPSFFLYCKRCCAKVQFLRIRLLAIEHLQKNPRMIIRGFCNSAKNATANARAGCYRVVALLTMNPPMKKTNATATAPPAIA